MKNKSFVLMTFAVISVLILSAVIITVMCVMPKVVIKRLYARCEENLDAAIEYTVDGRNDLAYGEIKKIVEQLDGREKPLMLFYDHNNVVELTGSAKTALELARTEDPAQLITELHDVKKAFEYLIHINDISIYNIF